MKQRLVFLGIAFFALLKGSFVFAAYPSCLGFECPTVAQAEQAACVNYLPGQWCEWSRGAWAGGGTCLRILKWTNGNTSTSITGYCDAPAECSDWDPYLNQCNDPCPENSTRIDGVCQCDSGYTDSGGVCVPSVCEPEPQFVTDLNLEWDYSACEWKYRECTHEAGGKSVPMSATPGAQTGMPFCSGGCLFVLHEIANDVGWWKMTDSSCSVDPIAPEQPDVAEAGDEENCVYDDLGNSHCLFEPWPTNCGYFNNELICLSSVPDNSCTQTASGAIFCIGDSIPTAPPDPPWEGAPPHPDADISGEVNDDTKRDATGDSGPRPYKWWDNDTVEEGGGVKKPGDPGGVLPYPSVVDVRIVDYGDLGGDREPVIPDLPGKPDNSFPDAEDGVPSWSDIGDTFSTAWTGSPLGAALDSLDFSIPSGNCPIWTGQIPWLNTTLVLDAHCDIWDSIAAILSVVSIMAYSYLAIRSFIR